MSRRQSAVILRRSEKSEKQKHSAPIHSGHVPGNIGDPDLQSNTAADKVQPNISLSYEKRASAWNRWVTLCIVAFLLLPFPFVRFEIWPRGGIVSERIMMPWSRFRICYVSLAGEEPVEERYSFTWKGEILPEGFPDGSPFIVSSLFPPLLKWQDSPEVVLGDLFYKGDFLRVKTMWRPLIIWPFELAWRMVPHGNP